MITPTSPLQGHPPPLQVDFYMIIKENASYIYIYIYIDMNDLHIYPNFR